MWDNYKSGLSLVIPHRCHLTMVSHTFAISYWLEESHTSCPHSKGEDYPTKGTNTSRWESWGSPRACAPGKPIWSFSCPLTAGCLIMSMWPTPGQWEPRGELIGHVAEYRGTRQHPPPLHLLQYCCTTLLGPSHVVRSYSSFSLRDVWIEVKCVTSRPFSTPSRLPPRARCREPSRLFWGLRAYSSPWWKGDWVPECLHGAEHSPRPRQLESDYDMSKQQTYILFGHWNSGSIYHGSRPMPINTKASVKVFSSLLKKKEMHGEGKESSFFQFL